MKNNTSPWLGFLAGVAVGAGLYAFLTSAEGKAWLEKLRQAASAFREHPDEQRVTDHFR